MNRKFSTLALCALAALACFSGGCQRSLLAVRESGDDNYAHGRYEAALTDYQEYLQRSPGRPEVYHMLGRTYLAMGQTGMARENLLIAHSLRVEDDAIFASACEGLYADKKYEDLNLLLKARIIDHGRMKDYLLLADYAQKQGDMDAAQSALLTAAKVDGGRSIQPQLELAKVYMKVGDSQRAVQRLRMAYFIDPKNVEVTTLAQQLGEIVGPSFAIMPEEQANGPVAPYPPREPPASSTSVPTEDPDKNTP